MHQEAVVIDSIRMMLELGRWLNRQLRRHGFSVQRHHPPGHFLRPIGRLDWFLEDIKARGFACRHVMDVGASDGSWSRSLLRVYPGASGLLVEPRPECVPALERFCAEHPGWSFVSTGVGAREGELPLALWDTSSTFLKRMVSLANTTVKVPLVRCDSLFGPDAVYPDLVKLDVEGFELEALSGADALLGRVDLLIIEVATFHFGTERPLARDIIAFLERRDYALYDVAGFIRRPYDGAIGLLDLVFARRGSSLTDHPEKWFAEQA